MNDTTDKSQANAGQETTHTPGPWVVGDRYTKCGVYTEKGDIVANTHGSYSSYDREKQIAEQDANALLIAAGPDMLMALRDIERYSECDMARKVARAAIAKAEGRT